MLLPCQVSDNWTLARRRRVYLFCVEKPKQILPPVLQVRPTATTDRTELICYRCTPQPEIDAAWPPPWYLDKE